MIEHVPASFKKYLDLIDQHLQLSNKNSKVMLNLENAQNELSEEDEGRTPDMPDLLERTFSDNSAVGMRLSTNVKRLETENMMRQPHNNYEDQWDEEEKYPGYSTCLCR